MGLPIHRSLGPRPLSSTLACALLFAGAAACSVTVPGASPLPGSSESPAAPSPSDVSAGGDIPDNAVFLTYADPGHRFSIQYVEGWQVRSLPGGVLIRDKDSSETVNLVPAAGDPGTYLRDVDLAELRTQAGFAAKRQDTVVIHGRSYPRLAYAILAPPDPVTGKRVPSSVDRYYVAGATYLAVVSLSTPDGVDNVDAFRQIIESFRW